MTLHVKLVLLEQLESKIEEQSQKSTELICSIHSQTPSKEFTARMNQPLHKLSPIECVASYACGSFLQAKSVGCEIQFQSLMMLLEQAIKQPDDPWPAEQLTSILDRIRRRDYPQCRKPNQ